MPTFILMIQMFLSFPFIFLMFFLFFISHQMFCVSLSSFPFIFLLLIFLFPFLFIPSVSFLSVSKANPFLLFHSSDLSHVFPTALSFRKSIFLQVFTFPFHYFSCLFAPFPPRLSRTIVAGNRKKMQRKKRRRRGDREEPDIHVCFLHHPSNLQRRMKMMKDSERGEK